MSLYNYIGTPNNNLVCCICRAPFNDPITTKICQHTFCRECIQQALSHVPQCPVDRSPLTVEELGPVNPIIRSLVDELLVECVYKGDGCDYRSERQLLALHLKETCQFSAEGKLGNEKAKSTDKGDGKHDDQASRSREIVEDADEEKSQEPLTKPSTPTTASPSSSSQSTSSTEPSSSGVSDSRLNQLTEQNILLRHKVDSLENVVQLFKKEMDAVKLILEPWMRNATSGPRPAAPNHIQPFPNTVQGEETSTAIPNFSPADIQQGSSVAERPRSGTVGPTSPSLSSYFPAEDEVRVRQQASQLPQPEPVQRPPRTAHAHHHSVPSMGNAMNNMDPYQLFNSHPANIGYAFPNGYNLYPNSYTGTGPYGNTVPSTIPGGISPAPTPALLQPQQTINFNVPDLNVATPSLLNTLQSLHSTVGSLTTVVEDVNRKSDVALALIGGGAGVSMMGGGVVGEVLRLGEEVMGVRASVQGLRMQVHGMLMGAVATPAPNVGYLARPPVLPTSANNAAGDEDAASIGRAQFPGQIGMNPRFGFPGPIGITKL